MTEKRNLEINFKQAQEMFEIGRASCRERV